MELTRHGTSESETRLTRADSGAELGLERLDCATRVADFSRFCLTPGVTEGSRRATVSGGKESVVDEVEDEFEGSGDEPTGNGANKGPSPWPAIRVKAMGNAAGGPAVTMTVLVGPEGGPASTVGWASEFGFWL